MIGKGGRPGPAGAEAERFPQVLDARLHRGPLAAVEELDGRAGPDTQNLDLKAATFHAKLFSFSAAQRIVRPSVRTLISPWSSSSCAIAGPDNTSVQAAIDSSILDFLILFPFFL